MSTSAAAKDVLAERKRQVDAEGWTAEHDDSHDQGELAKAASSYAWMSSQSDTLRGVFTSPPPIWPVEWSAEWWKPTSRRRDLVKAAALLIAEIERLDRASERDNAAEAAWERQQQSLMESGGPDNSAYRRQMTEAGRGHLLKG